MTTVKYCKVCDRHHISLTEDLKITSNKYYWIIDKQSLKGRIVWSVVIGNGMFLKHFNGYYQNVLDVNLERYTIVPVVGPVLDDLYKEIRKETNE